MSTVDAKKKRLVVKIVYYGPGLSGKTANLRHIYSRFDVDHRGRFIQRAMRGNTALCVEMLPLKVAPLEGYETTCNLLAVPGHALYNELRLSLLKGVDGVVFVADSRPSRMPANVDSLENLCENLRAQGEDLRRLPHVIQYNKQDLAGAMPVVDLRVALNRCGVPEFPASAAKGEGVMETLKAIVEATREVIRKRLY